MSEMKLVVGAKTDIGNIKKINQDSFLYKIGSFNESDFGLFVVCDGVGGLSKGEIASSKVIEIFNNWWNKEVKNLIKNLCNDEIVKQSIEETIHNANKELISFSKFNNVQLGTTVTVLFLINNKYYIAHVGDSRVYKIEKNVEQLTEDHTYYAKLLKEGNYEKAKTVKKSILVQCVGIKEDIEIYHSIGEINKTCTFLVCSDGFYNRMDNKKLKKLFKIKNINQDSLQDLCNQSIEEVKRLGERDNITLLSINTRMKKNILKKFRTNLLGGCK